MMQWIDIDGSQGEGGGQILRTSLSLSMITGKPVRFNAIRAGRAKPGLMRQHLTAVLAAQEICNAQVVGAQLGSTELSFIPGKVRPGDYLFDLGGAGSCTLVLQTLLPALWLADGKSTIKLRGGTHNPMAPSVTFLQQVWLPLMAKMGAIATLRLIRYGFYPAGGGEVEVQVEPVNQWQTLNLMARGQVTAMSAYALTANIPDAVAVRELKVVNQRLGWHENLLYHQEVSPVAGSGNALLLQMNFEHLSEVVCTIGTRGKSAEKVAIEACAEMQAYLDSMAVVGEHLADQLLLPMALAGAGRFSTHKVTAHLSTNMGVIGQFVNVAMKICPQDSLFYIQIG
ncbi:RNA 3'-terminal phosphate cyclase [Pragia fontium]|nr:RNA 3'-terminal phosphate cyclase [Pragia fontium]